MLRTPLVIMLWLSAGWGIANAEQDFPPFEAIPTFAPASIVLNVQGGHYDKWIKPLPCGVNRATVIVKFDDSNQNDKWIPMAKVQLNPLDAGKESDASHQEVNALITGPTKVHKATVSVQRRLGTASPEVRGTAAANLDSPLQIDLAWRQDGMIHVNFGGHYELDMPIDQPITRIGFSVSSAKFEFIDLKVGHVGPPDNACAN